MCIIQSNNTKTTPDWMDDKQRVESYLTLVKCSKYFLDFKHET